MSVTERRAEIIRILEGRRYETIDNLAYQLEVSRRTVRYDVQTLMTEYPIETVWGNGGGVRLRSDYRIYKGDITEEQQQALFRAIELLGKPFAKTFGELLRAHGSNRNKAKIEEVLAHL